jgi:hypothetical protein
MSSAARQAPPPAEIIKNTVALTLETPSTPGAGHDDNGPAEGALAGRMSSLEAGRPS